MSWIGYFEYDGNEVINVTRTETYAKNMGLHWLRPVFGNDALPFMLGDGLRYTTPMLDEAPWFDPDVPESIQFAGIYPLDVTGLEDSTRVSNPVESLGNGGVPGRLRHGMRTLVFNTVLIAATDAAADYGMKWLRQALLGNACGTPASEACSGGDLCFLSASPDMMLPLEGEDLDVDPEDCLAEFLRSFRKVTFNSGPTVSAKRTTTDGGAAWTVQFTAIVGSPYEFGSEVPVIEGFLDPEVAVPWAGGVPPEGAAIDLNGYIHPEAQCATQEYGPVYDPEFPAVIPPPSAPSVPLGNYTPPKNWRRRQFTIPKGFIPLWNEVVPKVEVHARTADLRNLRLRFYADPFQIGDISDDPCAYCGDIVVSYVPQDHTLVFDASEQAVHIIAPGGAIRRADSLVFKTDGTPFEWPVLSCGFGYVVTLDLPQTQEPPVIDLSLYPRAA